MSKAFGGVYKFHWSNALKKEKKRGNKKQMGDREKGEEISQIFKSKTLSLLNTKGGVHPALILPMLWACLSSEQVILCCLIMITVLDRLLNFMPISKWW